MKVILSNKDDFVLETNLTRRERKIIADGKAAVARGEKLYSLDELLAERPIVE